MQDFIITEGFPKSEIEFDLRFLIQAPVTIICFPENGPMALSVRNVKTKTIGLAQQLYICTNCEHQYSLTAGTIMDSSKKPITVGISCRTKLCACNLHLLSDQAMCL
jgi:hypothetical protein